MTSAAAKVKLPNDRTIEISSREMVKVLLIDDDHEFRHKMRNFLESKGCSVRVVSTPDDAKSLLKPNAYQVIIADIWFKSSDVTGDEFIAHNFGLMKDAKVVAVTARGINSIPHFHELNRLGVEIYEKGHFQFAESMKNLAAGAFEKRVEDISTVVEKAISCAVEGEATEAKTYPDTYHVLLADLVETLTEWFNTRRGNTEPILRYEGRDLCCDDLAKETVKGSPIGLQFMKILVRRFKSDLLKKDKAEKAAPQAEAAQPAETARPAEATVSEPTVSERAASVQAADESAAGTSQAAADN